MELLSPLLPDPEWRDAERALGGLPRILHGRSAAGVDQADGGCVLARDRRLHRGGLAPGVQLGGVRRRPDAAREGKMQ